MGIKYQVNEEFFDSWNTEMAYILGYLYADGSLEDATYLRGKYVRVTSTDKVTIETIKNKLQSQHKIVSVSPSTFNGKERYLLRIGSHKLYESLFNLGLYPNKSLTIEFPKVPKKYLSDFVRGYFDGDGCVFLERKKNKRQRMIIKKLAVIFTSGSKRFLQKLGTVLQEDAQTEQGKIYNGHRAFQLRYNTGDSVRLFKFFYKNIFRNSVFLERKLAIFLLYFKLRPSRVDKSIKSIVRYLKNGHVVK